jgi:hypothetical protein
MFSDSVTMKAFWAKIAQNAFGFYLKCHCEPKARQSATEPREPLGSVFAEPVTSRLPRSTSFARNDGLLLRCFEQKTPKTLCGIPDE